MILQLFIIVDTSQPLTRLSSGRVLSLVKVTNAGEK